MRVLLALILGFGVLSSTACKSSTPEVADMKAEKVTLALSGMT